jgi:hypothetical protein
MRVEQAKALTADEFHRLAAGLKPETRMVSRAPGATSAWRRC